VRLEPSGGGDSKQQNAMISEISVKYIQKRVGYSVAIAAAIAIFAIPILYGYTYFEAFLHPSSSLVFAFGIIMFFTALFTNKVTQIIQVFVFITAGYFSGLSATSGELTSVVLFGFALLLLNEYGLILKRALLKTVILSVGYLICLTIGLGAFHQYGSLVVIHTILGAALFAYLFVLMLKIQTKRHKSREAELETAVKNRTVDLEKKIEDNNILQEELRNSLDEKERLLQVKDTLLKEVHHRTKNNMQVISSLLNLESDIPGNEQSRKVLRKSISRIQSLAIAHEQLYNSDDFIYINLHSYIDSLVSDIWRGLGRTDIGLEQKVASDIMVDMDFAIPFGLILNETMTNAAKHAFPDSRAGTLSLDIHKQDEFIYVKIKDNGVGFPDSVDITKTKTLGLQLIEQLVKQLRGTYELDRTNGGTDWRFRLHE
jgi:two-component sensor histidine kinase